MRQIAGSIGIAVLLMTFASCMAEVADPNAEPSAAVTAGSAKQTNNMRHHQAQAQSGPHAEPAVLLAQTLVSGGDSMRCAWSPRSV